MLLFDMDGTLIDSNGVWKNVDREFLARRASPGSSGGSRSARRPHQSVVSRRNWNSSPRSQAASSAVPETKPHSLSRSGRSFTAAR